MIGSEIAEGTILVTGATGRIGRCVVKAALDRGLRVAALARHATRDLDAAKQLDRIDCDLADEGSNLDAAFDGVTAVIHLAGAADDDVDASSFVTGTERITKALSARRDVRLVVAGSISVYDFGAVADHGEIDEASPTITPTSRRDAYARCKCRQEEVVARDRAAFELDATVLRIGSVVSGSGSDAAAVQSPRLGLRLGSGIWVGPAGAPMPLVDLEDVAEALIREATRVRVEGDESPEIVNLVGLAQPTARRYAVAVAARGAGKLRRVELPWWLLRLLVACFDGIFRLPGLAALPRPQVTRIGSFDARFKPVRFSNALALERGLLQIPGGEGSSDRAPVVAYLTGEYPRATDTFVQREVAGLRAIGFSVQTYSVRRTSAAHHVGPEQRQEAAQTVTLLPLRFGWLIRSHVYWLWNRPASYVRTLRKAIGMARPGLAGFCFQFFYFAEAGMLGHDLVRRGCRHLHNHFANSSCSVAILASGLAGIPFSFTTHGPAIFFEPKIWRLGEKVAAARFVSCISHFCRSQVMAFSRIEDWSKLHIVHCGVDPSLYRRGERRPGPVKLLFVGRLAPVKGVPVLLEALASTDSDTSLTIIGDGEIRLQVEAEISRLGLSGRADVVGFKSQAEIAEALSEHDIFVMASFAEGVPVVLMEAMAAGLPVIATRIAGISELVEDGAAGLLVSPGDVDALRRAVDELAGDASRRDEMGARGRQIVAAEFDAAAEAARLGRLFVSGSKDVRCEPLGVCR